jgi:molybdopterin converting factor small subunit
MKQITIHYFASLRDERGLAVETVETDAETAAELYARIAAINLFGLERDRVRVAVNDAFAPWETPLGTGDKIVFIPPVAGG